MGSAQINQESADNMPTPSLTRTACWIGAAMLLVIPLNGLVSAVVAKVVAVLAPHLVSQGGVLYQAVTYTLISPLSILPGFFIVAKADYHKFKDLLPFTGCDFSEGVGCVLLSFLAILLGNGLSGGMELLFPTASENLTILMGEGAKTPAQLLAELIYVALVPALVEEIAFRGITLGMLRKHSDGLAIVLSALLFGLFHGNMIQLPFATCFGLAAGYITLRTGSLWPAIVLHFINNASSSLFSYFSPQISKVLGNYGILGLYGGWLLLGGLGLLILTLRTRRTGQTYRLAGGALSMGQTLVSLLKAVPLVIAVVINVAATIILMFPVM